MIQPVQRRLGSLHITAKLCREGQEKVRNQQLRRQRRKPANALRQQQRGVMLADYTPRGRRIDDEFLT